MDIDTIKQGLLEEIDAHREEIRTGKYVWFNIKIMLDRGGLSSQFSAQEKNRQIIRPMFQPEVRLSGRG